MNFMGEDVYTYIYNLLQFRLLSGMPVRKFFTAFYLGMLELAIQ